MTHVFHPTTLREYDIRGIVGTTLGEADAVAIGRGFATRVRQAGGRTVAVGYDGRHSSPALAAAVVAGLNASGVDAVEIGLGPTPMLYFAVHDLACDGGIMITGSHNPPDYNGFKLMLGHAPFFGTDIAGLGAMAAADDWAKGSGTTSTVDLVDRYVDRLLKDFAPPPLTIVWDAGNGAAGPVVERLTARLPGRHVRLFTEVDGDFPNHHPDPTEEHNLADLKAAVAAHGADMGLAFDGAGDRLGAVDGKGRVVWGDQLLGLLAEPVLRRHPGATIIADIKSSQALFDRVADLGGRPLMWKTGHSLIKAKMRETGAPLAGEMSGHLFIADDYYGFDDGLYAAVRLIGAVVASGRSLTELKDAMPALINTPELRFQCDETRKVAVVAEVLDRLRSAGATLDETDGARVTTPDGWWLLRASNTQDVLVARIEASSDSGMIRLRSMLQEQLSASGIAIFE